MQIIDRDKSSNRVKIHFVGYSEDFDEWRNADSFVNSEKSDLGRLLPRFMPSEDSLPDRASALFSHLSKEIKFALFSTKRESPGVRIEERIELDIYHKYLQNIGVVKKLRGHDVHCVDNNFDLCDLLGDKWFERIQNINGDFCYVTPGTVQFWLHEKKAVKEFFYVGDKLLEGHIENDLLVIFTFVRGDGVKAEYHTNDWKSL